MLVHKPLLQINRDLSIENSNKTYDCVGANPPALSRASRSPGLEIIEQPEDPVDVGVLVVEAPKGAGEADRIARVVALVELLATGERRHCCVEGKAEKLDPGLGVGVRGLEIGRDVGCCRPVELGVGRDCNKPARTQELDDLAHPHEHLGIHHAYRP